MKENRFRKDKIVTLSESVDGKQDTKKDFTASSHGTTSRKWFTFSH